MAGEFRLRLDADGGAVLPVEVRRALRVLPGDEVLLVRKENAFFVTTRRLLIESAQKRLRRYVKPGVSMVDELIKERRAEAKREEAHSRRRG